MTATRKQLRTAYLTVVDNWAVSAAEIAKEMKTDAKTATALLRKLKSKKLVESTHVNEEKTLTWQSYFDVENEPDAHENAIAAFDAAYPEPVKIVTGISKRTGATGPTYTDEQIRRAKQMREKGESWKAIAAELDVKAPGHLSWRIRHAA